MKASSANLLTVIKGPKQFVIPIYQRTYSWQLAQCDQLLKDIIRISKNDNLQGHFLGSIVYFQDGFGTEPDIIIERDLNQILWKSDTQLEKLRSLILTEN